MKNKSIHIFTKLLREIFMNIKEWEILNQRYLSEITNISLGMIKKSLKKLKIEGFIDNIIN